MLSGAPGATWPLLAALPLAGWLSLRLFRGALGQALNTQLARTAQYQLALTALMILGLLIA